MCEIMWKPVEGFEDKYLVSNTGLVYGIKRKHLQKLRICAILLNSGWLKDTDENG